MKKPTFGQQLIEAAKQAVSIARGEADPSMYRVHHPEAPRAIQAGRITGAEDCAVFRTGRVLSNGCGR